MGEIAQFLNQEPVLLLFLIIGLGYLVGGISLGGDGAAPPAACSWWDCWVGTSVL
jgi:hypothetical protein